MVTDAAINIAPDLATKVDICQNAIDLALSLGIEPRVGVLSAVETVNPAIQSSIDAALLSKMADRGQIKGGLVEGPLAMDNAVDMAPHAQKGSRAGWRAAPISLSCLGSTPATCWRSSWPSSAMPKARASC